MESTWGPHQLNSGRVWVRGGALAALNTMAIMWQWQGQGICQVGWRLSDNKFQTLVNDNVTTS